MFRVSRRLLVTAALAMAAAACGGTKTCDPQGLSDGRSLANVSTAVTVGGAVVLAGLLSEQAASVAAAYEPWFTMDPPRDRDGWTGLSGRRH